MRRIFFSALLVAALLAGAVPFAAAAPDNTIGINVVLSEPVSDAILADLGTHGRVLDVLAEINALTMRIKASELAAIQALSYVAAANSDAARNGGPVNLVASGEEFSDGMSTWDLDITNVTEFNAGRQVDFDGAGVYVAVIDSGLVKNWREYFPAGRVATEYGVAFGGGGGERGWVSTQPNKWQLDVNSHGTHVTSTILGYRYPLGDVNGVAPLATVIPVKVLNQNGSGWSSVVARGIRYVADLKAGPLAGHPVVINMSLGGPELDAMEEAAIDYAIAQGVIVVASAGNEGTSGMGYPGAYEPVISVAASGWTGEWTAASWWRTLDVPESAQPDEAYIVDFSSRELPGQDLDLAAPGTWVVGPYETNSGQRSWYYLGGTSMASPHVAGTVALMAQKNPALTASQADAILTGSAVYLAPGSRSVWTPYGYEVEYTWGADATGSGLLDVAAALAGTP